MPKYNRTLRLRSEPNRQETGRANKRANGRASGRQGERATGRIEAAEQDTKLTLTPSPAHALTRSPHLPVAPTRRTSASAVAKLILCGEHAVVYGRPAIALPLASIRAHVDIADGHVGSGMTIHAHDLRRRWRVADDPHGPISQLITNVLAYFEAHQARSSLHLFTPSPDLHITISSTIPIASGMGSGAAVAAAVVRALAAHLGQQLSLEEISALVYTSEQRFHGTPSGIDNTVVVYEQPIWFVRQSPSSVVSGQLQEDSDTVQPTTDNGRPTIEPIVIASPFTLLIGETGVRSATRLPVGEVRRRWQAETARYEALFDQVGSVVTQTRAALEQGDIPAIGPLLSQNHTLLQQIGVSSPQLDALVSAAQAAGALGAKLSGAGWGGIMLALVTPETRARVTAAIEQAGAKRVSATAVKVSRPELPTM